MIRTYLAVALTALLLSSCVGGTLSKQEDQEEYPLREATKSESTDLKQCLRDLHAKQENRKEKANSYFGTIKAMKPDSSCDDFKLKLKKLETGYEIEAKKSDGESTVLWSINQDGIIEESLEPEEDELDF